MEINLIPEREVRRVYERDYYAKNREKLSKKGKLWAIQNKDKIKMASKNWKENNPEKLFALQLKHKYKLTTEWYHTVFLKQKGCCAICGKHQSNFIRRLSVDHNHTTGQIRALLCNTCNTGLGHYELFKEKFKQYLDFWEDNTTSSQEPACVSGICEI